jgi:hypothetical protein
VRKIGTGCEAIFLNGLGLCRGALRAAIMATLAGTLETLSELAAKAALHGPAIILPGTVVSLRAKALQRRARVAPLRTKLPIPSVHVES